MHVDSNGWTTRDDTNFNYLPIWTPRMQLAISESGPFRYITMCNSSQRSPLPHVSEGKKMKMRNYAAYISSQASGLGFGRSLSQYKA
jgi:hypothetical protein